MTQFVTGSGGGVGVQNTLAANENLIVNDGVVIYSDDDSVIVGSTRNNIILAENSSVIGFGTGTIRAAISLGTSASIGVNSTVNIAQTASVISSGYAILMHVTNGKVTNRGFISSEASAIDVLATSADVINFGDVSATGLGVRVFKAGQIINYGNIHGESYGATLGDGAGLVSNSGVISGNTAVFMGGSQDAGSPNKLNNTGELIGGTYGVYSSGESADILNTGVIMSADSVRATIIHNNFNVEEYYLLTNSGTVQSAGYAYSGTLSVDEIQNTGLISGRIELGAGDDIIESRNGILDGAVYGGEGNDTVFGGTGDDILHGDTNDDVLSGGRGNDALFGGDDADVLGGGMGSDTIGGGDGDDVIKGGQDDDVLDGDFGDDQLFGGRGDDTLNGGGRNDVMFGGQGDDVLVGGNGTDELRGGRGDDRLTGGGKGDVFVFNCNSDEDVITDFENGFDKIDLTAFGLRPVDFASVVDPALSNAGGGATFLDLDLMGGNGSVLIEGLAFGDANASDFIL